MLKELVIWGAGGHAKVLGEFVERCGFRVAAVFDNDPAAASPFPGVPLHVGTEGFEQWRRENAGPGFSALVAIGGARGQDRHRIQRMLASHGIAPATAVHPAAYVAGDVRIGAGSQVLVHATVAVSVTLGEACIVNTAASVDHECVLGHGVHVAPGATLAGCVQVGDYSLVAPGAVVLPRVRIGARSIVGAGSVVTRDVPDGVVAFGSPARVRRENPTE